MEHKRKKQPVLTLKNDLLFKAVYGSDTKESKFILINLLNKILDRRDDPITDIEYKNPFILQECEEEKESVLDIKAITDSNELIDIEMQIIWKDEMPFRLIYYHGGLIREALPSGDDYAKMKKTITICITDSIVFENTDKFLTQFYFMEETEHIIFSKMTCICCIELPKVNMDRRSISNLTPLEICLEYLKYANENDSEYVEELIRRGGKELEMAQTILKKVTQEEILREKALSREKYEHDYATWGDGEIRPQDEYYLGRTKGYLEGRENTRIEVARNLKKAGISDNIISETTGFAVEEIENL